jgi:hypothetical protein
MADLQRVATHGAKKELETLLKSNYQGMQPATFRNLLNLSAAELKGVLEARTRGSDAATGDLLAARANGQSTGNAAIDAVLPQERVCELLTGSKEQIDQVRAVARLASRMKPDGGLSPAVLQQLLTLHPDAAVTATSVLSNSHFDPALAHSVLADIAAQSNARLQSGRACDHNSVVGNPAFHRALLEVPAGSMRDTLMGAAGRGRLTQDQCNAINQAASNASTRPLLDSIFADATPNFDKVRLAQKLADAKLSDAEAQLMSRAVRDGHLKPTDLDGILSIRDAATRQGALDLAASGIDPAVFGRVAGQRDASALVHALKERLMTPDQVTALLERGLSADRSEQIHGENVRTVLRAIEEGKARASARDIEQMMREPMNAFDRYLDLDARYHSNPELVATQKRARTALRQIEPHLDADGKAAMNQFVRERIPEDFRNEFDQRLLANRVSDLEWLATHLPPGADAAARAQLALNPLRLAAEAAGVRARIRGAKPDEELVIVLHGTNARNANDVTANGPTRTNEWYVSPDVRTGRAYGREGDNMGDPAIVAVAIPRTLYDQMIKDGRLCHTTPAAQRRNTPERLIAEPDGKIYRESDYCTLHNCQPGDVAHLCIGTEMKFTPNGIDALVNGGAAFFRLDQPRRPR